MKPRNILLSVLIFFPALSVSAQSLRLTQGEVTFVHSSANTADMTYTGNSLTIEGRRYQLDNATTMEVTTEGVADNTVSVAYNGNSANVTVAGNIAKYLTVRAIGADVCIVAAPELQQQVEYTLSGTSADGSFYMDGSYAASFKLDNLTLTNADSAAINIQDGKLITIELNGQNALADGVGKMNNACLFVNGHAKFIGSGRLDVTGNAKHGITGDEHLVVESGNINVTAVGDGLHISEYFKQTGGSLVINSKGDGIDVGFKGVNKGTKDQYPDNGFAFLEGGNIDITVTGDAVKGIKADSTIVVSGITANVTTSGNAVFDALENDISSSAALKTGGKLDMTSGKLTLVSTGAGGKGVNATGNVELAGGEISVTTTGAVWVYGIEDSKPHGVKSDADINLKGGRIFVAASNDSGAAFKTDYFFTISGGTIMGIGAKNSKPTSNTQQYYSYSGVNVKGGQTLSYNGVSFTVPAIYSNSSARVLVSGK